MLYTQGASQELSKTITTELYQYRYQVFVECLGWELDVPPGRETDQFDHDETIYVIAETQSSKTNKRNIVGCARLLPTTMPYLLEEVFPELLNGAEIPKSEEVWELSRFTSCDLAQSTKGSVSQFSPETTVGLLQAALACAKQRGAKRVISVSPIGVERLLRKAGFKSRRAGPSMIIDGYPLVACWIDIE